MLPELCVREAGVPNRVIQGWTTSWRQNVNRGTHGLAMGTNGESITDGQDLSGDMNGSVASAGNSGE